jgi:hypothetical protein
MGVVKTRPTAAGYVSRVVFDGKRALTQPQAAKIIKASTAAVDKACETASREGRVQLEKLKRALDRRA